LPKGGRHYAKYAALAFGPNLAYYKPGFYGLAEADFICKKCPP
jgi:hypothetical protein